MPDQQGTRPPSSMETRLTPHRGCTSSHLTWFEMSIASTWMATVKDVCYFSPCAVDKSLNLVLATGVTM